MTSVDLRSFVVETLVNLGAEVAGLETHLWVQAPGPVRERLEVPSAFALAFDPAHADESGADLVAPGSYFLDRLLAAATMRGRWDSARVIIEDAEWPWRALTEQGLSRESTRGLEMVEVWDATYFLFTFRLTLLADEMRESLHALVVAVDEGLAWSFDLSPQDSPLPGDSLFKPPRVEEAYRLAQTAMRERTSEDVRTFRTRSLRLLEEEVRRIFNFYDQTIKEVREADPSDTEPLVRSIETERGRRLAETLARFEPRATASLCAVRAVRAPTATLRWSRMDGILTLHVDAWTKRIRGLECDGCRRREGPWSLSADRALCPSCIVTTGGSVRPRGRRRSGTPRRGTQGLRGSKRSPRGSKAPPRGASRRSRGP